MIYGYQADQPYINPVGDPAPCPTMVQVRMPRQPTIVREFKRALGDHVRRVVSKAEVSAVHSSVTTGIERVLRFAQGAGFHSLGLPTALCRMSRPARALIPTCCPCQLTDQVASEMEVYRCMCDIARLCSAAGGSEAKGIAWRRTNTGRTSFILCGQHSAHHRYPLISVTSTPVFHAGGP